MFSWSGPDATHLSVNGSQFLAKFNCASTKFLVRHCHHIFIIDFVVRKFSRILKDQCAVLVSYWNTLKIVKWQRNLSMAFDVLTWKVVLWPNRFFIHGKAGLWRRRSSDYTATSHTATQMAPASHYCTISWPYGVVRRTAKVDVGMLELGGTSRI